MSATSGLWLGWMLATVAIYWLTPARFRDIALILLTLAFLLTNAPESAVVLSIFTFGTYYLGGAARISNTRLAVAASGIVTTLVIYKLRLTGDPLDWISAKAIPLGLSYYAFRCLHYLIERYKGTLAAHTAREFTGYLFFLPTIVVGPIHRFPAYRRDLRRLHWDSGKFADGLERILYGYFKIMVLGVFVVSEQLGQHAQSIADTSPWWSTYLRVIEHALYGYLLFAGYSDIAIGFALLLGVSVMENFNAPFVRKNISEFWQSWHISLTSWVREYVYMSVAATTRSAALAALVAMLFIGLWHEISLRYLLWGAYHGLGIVAWQQFQKLKPTIPLPRAGAWRYVWHGLSVIITFHFVAAGFVLVNEPGLADALGVFKRLFLVEP